MKKDLLVLDPLLFLNAFVFLIYRLMKRGRESNSNIPRFVALGTGLVLLIHFTINMGSTLGLLPVIGIGLPFVSYGGTSLVISMSAIGILLNVSSNGKEPVAVKKRTGSGKRYKVYARPRIQERRA